MSNDAEVRKQLVALLTVRQAHLSFEDAIKDFPESSYNDVIPNGTYTFWHIIEHLRLTQWDILDYITNPDYSAPAWPREYWPDPAAKTDRSGWETTVEQFRDDLAALVNIVEDPETNLYEQIAHGATGHTIIREIEVIGAHNAYHLGEFAILRQVCNLWPQDR